MTDLLQKSLPYLALVLIYLAVASNFRVSAQPLLAQSSASLRSGLLALGLLIHVVVGSCGGVGGLETNRSGCDWKAASKVTARCWRTSSAVP